MQASSMVHIFEIVVQGCDASAKNTCGYCKTLRTIGQ